MANLNYYKKKMKQMSLTEWLIVINVVMFIISNMVDLILGSGLLRMGAKVNFLIAGGQYWRLFSAQFLHASLIHLIFNMAALYYLGKDIERFYGPKKFLIIYLGSGLAGSTLSFLLVSNVSVGASGAIFGLMGANLNLYKKNPTAYRRLYGNDIIALVAINILIGLFSANIDMAGHIGGLIAGFVIASAVGVHSDPYWVKQRLLSYVLSGVLIFAPFAIGLYQNYQSADFYATSAYYYTSLDKVDKAMHWTLKGLEKFPTDTNLLYFKEALSGEI